MRRVDPNNPLLALVDGSGRVSGAQSRAIKEHQILVMLRPTTGKNTGTYTSVSREYLAAKKGLS